MKQLSSLIADIIARLVLPPIKDGVIITTIFDFDLRINRDDGANYYYLGFYELGTLDIFNKCLKEGDIFIDIGASVGQMSLFASDLVGKSGKLFSFEQMKNRYSNLKKNLEINNRTNMEIFNMALGHKKENMKFYDVGYYNPFLPPIFYYFFPNKRRYGMVGFNKDLNHFYVKVDRLDNILEENKVNNVRLIKIDTEGFEPYVLLGAKKLLSQKDAPIICLEQGGSPVLDGEIIIDSFTLLREANQYRFFKLCQTKKFVSKLVEIDLDKYQKNADNYFCFLPHHLDQLPKEAFKV
ncbi:MAG: FkbM family methyltransferase [Bacteroidetes bacterium]|nr:FkbM family methyltransferase [Bacteroidota bacterium]